MHCPLFKNIISPARVEIYKDSVLYACPDCGVRFWHPAPSAPFVDFYEQSSMYEFVALRPPAWYHRQFLDAPPVSTGKLLDVGFGQGEFLNAARRFDFELYGIDIAERNVRMAQNHYHLNNLTVSSLQDFGRAHPGLRFDVITAFEVLEHVPDPADFIASAVRMISRGGYLVLSTPDADRFGGTTEDWDYPPNHLFQWNAKTLTRLLEAHGLRVVRTVQQPFTKDFFFIRGVGSFGIMKRLRSRRVVVEKGTGPRIIHGERGGLGFFSVLEFLVHVGAIIKNIVLRIILIPVEYAFRVAGITYWDLYIVAQLP